MTGEGVVVRTNGAFAVVKIRKSSACGHDCGECRVCNNPEFETEVLNEIGAKEGDKVLIGAPANKILFSAFLVYMLPLIGLFLSYLILSTFFKNAFVISSGCVIWLAVWFSIIRFKNKSSKNEMSTILEVINEKN